MWESKVRTIELTPERLEQARAMRAQGAIWADIVRKLGVSKFVLCCALEPEYRDRARRAVINSRARRKGLPKYIETNRENALLRDRDGRHFGHASIGDFVTSVNVPHSVEMQRERLLAFRHTELTAALMGDPPIWRSALGKKNKWP